MHITNIGEQIISGRYPGHLFDPTIAEALAAEWNAEDEDGWTYKVKHDPTGKGKSLIEAYDERGDYLGDV